MTNRWSVHAPDPEARRVADAFKIHPVIADILLRRGFQSEAEIFSFLNPSLDDLEDPFMFQDMKKPSSASAARSPEKRRSLSTATMMSTASPRPPSFFPR